MNFLDLAEQILKLTGKPMAPKDIWNKAVELGLDKELGSEGKTPWASLSAQLGTAVLKGKNKKFERMGKPHLYYLTDNNSVPNPPVSLNNLELKHYLERDLHPLLVRFANQNDHFKSVVKTINHSTSAKGNKGENEWLHPDLVGFYFPYNNFQNVTLELLEQFNQNQYRLFSFEMKKEVSYSNLREYYFQAVSNSSWANEGYLVALHFDSSTKFREELARLNQAFGIGVIQLNPENVDDSEILYPAEIHEVDWVTVNRLVEINKSFRSFIKSVEADIKSHYPHPSEYDRVYTPEEMTNHIADKGIL